MQFVFDWILRYGYAGLFALLVLGIAGLPIPDETLLVFSGFLISKGRLNPVLTYLAGFAGSVSGISVSYALGRFVGEPILLRYGRFLGFTAAHLERVRHWYSRTGEWVLAFGYFIPGVRHWTALVAGASHLDFRTFALFAYCGGAVWIATFLGIGYLLGDNWRAALDLVHRYTTVAVVVVVVVVALAVLIRWRVRRRTR